MNKIIYSKLVLLILIVSMKSYSAPAGISDSTVVNFADQNELIVLTTNPDSIDNYAKKPNYPNPFGPTMEAYAAKILLKESSFAKVILKNADEETVAVFNWDPVKAGVYKFRWWKYDINFPSGVYYVVVTTGFNTTIDKVF